MRSDIFMENFFTHTVIPPERQIQTVFPLKEIGFLEAAVHKDLVYSDILEFNLRLSSCDPFAVDILDGKRVETPLPHVLIKRPGLHHHYRVDNPRKAFFLQYRPETAADMERAGFSFEPLVWRFSMTDTIVEGIDRLLKISPLLHLPLMKEKADALAWALLLELLEYRSGIVPDDEVFAKLQRISSYLLVHYLESPNIAELARAHGFSERSLFRHWKKYYPESPSEMIQRLKLDHAKNCLRHTGMTVGEIAAMLHCSPIYFDRFFRNKTGCTPLQYRKLGISK